MSGNEPSAAALWLEAAAGTERAFAVPFDRHRCRIFRKAYSRVTNIHDTEDIVAMVFLGAWVSSQLPCSFLEQEDGDRRERLVWRKKTTENPIRRSNPAPSSLTDPRS